MAAAGGIYRQARLFPAIIDEFSKPETRSEFSWSLSRIPFQKVAVLMSSHFNVTFQSSVKMEVMLCVNILFKEPSFALDDKKMYRSAYTVDNTSIKNK